MSSHLSALTFETLSAETASHVEPRHGRLCFRKQDPIETPRYVAVSSRGAVPHLSQDMMRDQTSVRGIYAALEDCE